MATLDSLHRIQAEDVGIVIVDEVHSAASDTRADALLAFNKAAMWELAQPLTEGSTGETKLQKVCSGLLW